MDKDKMERIKKWIETEIKGESDSYPYQCKQCPARFKDILKAKEHFSKQHDNVSLNEFVTFFEIQSIPNTEVFMV